MKNRILFSLIFLGTAGMKIAVSIITDSSFSLYTIIQLTALILTGVFALLKGIPQIYGNTKGIAAIMLSYTAFVWGANVESVRAIGDTMFFVGWLPAIISIIASIWYIYVAEEGAPSH